MKYKNLQKKRGFVILFAVTLSALLLAITLGVSNIALREVKFSTNARDTNDSFFAADTGIECARYYDRFPPYKAFTNPIWLEMSCAGSADFYPEYTDRGTTDSWSFKVSKLGSEQQGCVIVTVEKTRDDPVKTTIISKGYNTGGDNEGVCDYSSNLNVVEREIIISY